MLKVYQLLYLKEIFLMEVISKTPLTPILSPQGGRGGKN
jgi:hypothetical protein